MPIPLTKLQQLRHNLAKLDSLLVAFSAGVDSSLLLKVAVDVLGKRVLAVTADSPAVPRQEIDQARQIAQNIGARHVIIQTNELNIESYRSNPVNRCYFCKSELYGVLISIAKQHAISAIANGTNLDDLGDYRPGLQAADEFRVISPLKEAQLTKNDVRALARRLGLQVWEKPASPCLASRIPYGQQVTATKLGQIEAAESFLKSLDFNELRVRHFGKQARIEIPEKDFLRLTTFHKQIDVKFAELGFQSVDITEFNSGSLNRLAGVQATD